MANTFTVKAPRIVGHIHSLPLPTRHGPEAATQTFVKGDILKNTSGTLVLATDNVEGELILGAALGPASGTTATQIPFTPFLPGTIIEANLSTTAGAYVMIAGDLYASFSLGVTGGIAYLDEDIRNSDASSGSQLFATVIGFARDRLSSGRYVTAAVGDTDARVLAVVTNSAFTMGLSVQAT